MAASGLLDQVYCVSFAESGLLGHVCWIRFAVSRLLDQVYCVSLAESGLPHQVYCIHIVYIYISLYILLCQTGGDNIHLISLTTVAVKEEIYWSKVFNSGCSTYLQPFFFWTCYRHLFFLGW